MSTEPNIQLSQKRGSSPPFFSIALISACVLGYEILLMRLLSIIQWHHFAYMIISLALLAYGMSGTFLTLIKDKISAHFNGLYTLNAVLFGISTIGCFSIAQQIPFNGLELVWNLWQIVWLFLIYVLLCLPFFFAANCFGLAFSQFRKIIHRTYHWDLVGAGVGALFIIFLLSLFNPTTCLKMIAVAGPIAALLTARRNQRSGLLTLQSVIILSTAVLLLLWPSTWLELKISQYKGLPKTLQISGTEVIEQRTSPFGLLTVVKSPQIPFRHAPGLSLASRQEPPDQLGVFTDGDAMTAITRYEGRREYLSYLDDLSSALAYHLIEKPRTLILGAGGGADVLQALYHDSTSIDAVEINPQMVELVRDQYAEFAGNVYRHPRVKIHICDARGYLAANHLNFDLIQVSMLDSFASSGAGTHALSENYLYTVEALQEAYAHLNDDGLISITRWLKLPPRDSLKLFATAVQALNQSGVTLAGLNIAFIRSWQTSTLLIKKGPFTQADIDRLRNFSTARSFDVVYYPGITPSETNRYNILDQDYLYQGANILLSERSKHYLDDYKFNLQPASDNQPYFFHFFKWSLLPELLKLREQGGLVLLDSGYLVLVATLLQALPITIILILIPVAVFSSRHIMLKQAWRPGLYFLFLGLAFLFIEIAFIQRFILFMSHPIYAAATVLSGFLFFAGLGSGVSTRLQRWANRYNRSAIDLAIIGIGLISVIYVLLLPTLLSMGMALAMAIKAFVTILLIAPMAFFMGMPFPLGLARLATLAPEFIPWAWGINGCASVLSAIMATMIAIHFGFQAVIVLAVTLYALASIIWR
jgi:spermidine synthase